MPKKPITAITVISEVRDQRVSRSAALVVIHGEDLGRKYDLQGKDLTIGRSSKSDIPIDQDSVSRHHARVFHDGSRVMVEDLKSTNGTFVNDEQIDEEHRLKNNDLIKVGRTILKFIASNNIEAAYHDEIYRLTTVDGLTQVSNRRYFEDTLDRELSRCRRYHRSLSLVMVDVDHFKKINDTWGHLAGDAVLKEVATTIRGRIRREDVIARYGGEEFALLLPEIDLKGAVAMAEKVRKLVEKHRFVFDDQQIPVTVSCGVASLAKKNETGPALVKRADEKLYQAKDTGRNRVCS